MRLSEKASVAAICAVTVSLTFQDPIVQVSIMVASAVTVASCMVREAFINWQSNREKGKENDNGRG